MRKCEKGMGKRKVEERRRKNRHEEGERRRGEET